MTNEIVGDYNNTNSVGESSLNPKDEFSSPERTGKINDENYSPFFYDEECLMSDPSKTNTIIPNDSQLFKKSQTP